MAETGEVEMSWEKYNFIKLKIPLKYNAYLLVNSKQ